MAFTFWRWVTAFVVFATIFGPSTWRQRPNLA